MKLSKIIENIKSKIEIENFTDLDINGIQSDSRLIEKNESFIALKGLSSNGENYISNVIEKGASVIVCSKEFDTSLFPNIIFIKSDNAKYLMGEILNIIYPNKPKYNVGVTGTNGKTSVANYVMQALQELIGDSISIGTLGLKFSKLDIPRENTLTVFETVDLHKKIDSLKKQYDIKCAVYELTSQGMDQDRLEGITLDTVGFTMISRDHMDYHKTFDNYLNCKLKSFSHVLKKGGTAILNSDIEQFSQIKDSCQKAENKIITYGENGDIKLLKVEIIENNKQKICFSYNEEECFIITSLLGIFQPMNLLCSFGIIKSTFTNSKSIEIANALSKVKSAEGRMDLAGIKNNGGKIYIDYACVPEAMELTIKSARDMIGNKGKIILVFGAGGDRMKEKRPLMGKIACELADFSIITDDNPRGEDATKIRKDIINGFTKNNYLEEREHRKFAIAKGIEMLESNDILLLLGKGHEKYIISATGKEYFNEFEIVREELQKFNNK